MVIMREQYKQIKGGGKNKVYSLLTSVRFG
jgi:hypothetical protein